MRYRPHRLGIGNHQPFKRCRPNALPGLKSGTFARGQRVPRGLPRTTHRRTRRLRDAVDVVHVEAHRRDRLEHSRWRRRPGGQDAHRARQGLALLLRRIGQHGHHGRRRAEVVCAVLGNRVEDAARSDLAQTDVRACGRRDRPREAPAVRMEHRQRPQIDRGTRHSPVGQLQQAHQVGAAMAGHDTLRVTGGPRRVVQRDRLPLVEGHDALERRIAFREQRLVVGDADGASRRGFRIVDVDQDRGHLQSGDGLGDQRRELAVHEQQLALSVLQDERDAVRVQTAIDRVEHGAGQRDSEMSLEHCRRVGRDDRHRVTAADAAADQGRSEAIAALARLRDPETAWRAYACALLAAELGAGEDEA